jgi:hypothetical protein
MACAGLDRFKRQLLFPPPPLLLPPVIKSPPPEDPGQQKIPAADDPIKSHPDGAFFQRQQASLVDFVMKKAVCI